MRPSELRAMRRALLRHGVVPRVARRTVVELRDHYADIVQAERENGKTLVEAEVEADSRIGSVDELTRSVLRNKDLLSISHSNPTLAYLVLPPLCFVLVALVVLAVTSSFSNANGHLINVRPVSEAVNWAVSHYLGIVLWVCIWAAAYRTMSSIALPFCGSCIVAAMGLGFGIRTIWEIDGSGSRIIQLSYDASMLASWNFATTVILLVCSYLILLLVRAKTEI